MLIKEIMTTRVATVSMDDRLSVIKEIFEQAHFRHLLVVEEEELVGVISDRDLLRALRDPLIFRDSNNSKCAGI